VLLAAAILALLPGSEPSAATRGPDFRVRISTDEVAETIACRGGLRILDPAGRPVWRDPVGPKVTFVAEVEGAVEVVYRAQVASLSSEGAARALADDLAGRLGVPAKVHYHPDRGSWRVRVGEARRPDDLDGLVQSLRGLGYAEIWVTEDAPLLERGRIRLVDDRWNDFLPEARVLRVVPARASDRLQVGEGTYRGVLDVMLDRRGRLAVINQLPLEQYLRGVVPNELGPNAFPEVEALKAQAVAARTYAWRNRGQFAEDGYDLCDTVRCQVYKGAGTEHPVTDEAVRGTAGLVLLHGGGPINAMYTSTCGGHTEDGRLLFSEETGAYLKGVPCYPERQARRERVLLLKGREPAGALAGAEGGPLGREAWLLASLGIVDPDGWTTEMLAAPPSGPEAAAWVDAALEIVGKGRRSGRPFRGKTRKDLVRELIRLLDWEERARLRVDAADVDYLLDFGDGGRVPGSDRRGWALLLKDGILRPLPDHTLRPAGRPGRREWVRVLAALVDHYDADGLERGALRGIRSGALVVDGGGEERLIRLGPEARLVKSLRGAAYPVHRMEALVGDKVAFHAGPAAGGAEAARYLEVAVSPKSASDDRYIKVYEWEERVSRQEMARRLASRIRGIGDLVDLVVAERGDSGRAIALEVVGSRGRQTIRGFDIRRALEVRETLFVIDRQRDRDGNVEAFVITGKGWGHGVGMCQVGAYGMALRGESFRAILSHYYTGARLEKAYP
jgi:stage II sporulation protein D